MRFKKYKCLLRDDKFVTARKRPDQQEENSHVTLYVLHFPDATWDRFPRSRVRGTCRRVVWHVL